MGTYLETVDAGAAFGERSGVRYAGLVVLILASCGDSLVTIPAGEEDGAPLPDAGAPLPEAGVPTGPEDRTYRIGGVVEGLRSMLVLRDAFGDDLVIEASGPFRFSRTAAPGASYDVTVKVQPRAPAQTCALSNGAGTVGNADVDGIRVACVTATHALRGKASFLAPGASVSLQNNGGPALIVDANGTFAFPEPVDEGSTYAVTVSAQPATQNCKVSRGTGTVGTGDVTDVELVCIQKTFQISTGGSTARQGSYFGNQNSASHNAGAPQYLTGVFPEAGVARSYFVFDLSGVPPVAVITGATLSAPNESGGASDTRTWEARAYPSDVGSLANLTANRNGAHGGAIWSQLGSGALLGSVAVVNPSATLQTMPFNAAGRAAIQAAIGGEIAFSTTYAEDSTQPALLFVDLSGPAVTLVLEATPPP